MANACGVDFGTSNSTVGLVRPGQPALLVARGRQADLAVGGVFQRRRRGSELWPRRPGGLPGRLRRAPDALAQEPARHQPDRRPDRGRRARAAVPHAAGPLHRRGQAPRRAGRRPPLRLGRARPPGVLHRRQRRGRQAGRRHPGRGRARGRLQAHRLPVRADRRRLRLRVAHRARGTGADRRHRRRHLRLLAGAPGARTAPARPTAATTSSPPAACTSAAPISTST